MPAEAVHNMCNALLLVGYQVYHSDVLSLCRKSHLVLYPIQLVKVFCLPLKVCAFLLKQLLRIAL